MTTTVNLVLQTRMGHLDPLDGQRFGNIPITYTWAEFFAFNLDENMRNNLKVCDFIISKSARGGRCRRHVSTDTIEDFISTFILEQSEYKVHLLKSIKEESLQGFRIPEVPTLPKINPRASSSTKSHFGGDFMWPNPFGDGSNGLKRPLKQEEDVKSPKMSRLLCKTMGVNGVLECSLIVEDGNKSTASSDWALLNFQENEGVIIKIKGGDPLALASSELEEVQGETENSNAEDFNDSLEGTYGATDQSEGAETEEEFREVQNKTSNNKNAHLNTVQSTPNALDGDDDEIQILFSKVNHPIDRPVVKIKTEVEFANPDGNSGSDAGPSANASTLQGAQGENSQNDSEPDPIVDEQAEILARKSSFIQNLKDLSTDEFELFQDQLSQLLTRGEQSRTDLISKAPHISSFLLEFFQRSNSLEEFTEKVENKLMDSRFQKMSEEITRLGDESQVGNIFTPELTIFLLS